MCPEPCEVAGTHLKVTLEEPKEAEQAPGLQEVVVRATVLEHLERLQGMEWGKLEARSLNQDARHIESARSWWVTGVQEKGTGSWPL